MDDQNPNDPLMLDIANLYIHNREEFINNAKLFTARYATE
jgi:ubiquitin-protein ligase